MERRPVLQREDQLAVPDTLPSWTMWRPSGKPLLRGWFHAAAAITALALTAMLLARSGGIQQRYLSLLIFGASMCELYTGSALFHLGMWRWRGYAAMRALDHSSIYAAIAGTYTPLCVMALSGWMRTLLLGSVWLLALAGVALTVGQPRLSRRLRTSCYVALGWAGMPLLPAVWRAFPPSATALLVLGGLLYSLGAVVYLCRQPDPFPRVLGYHEVFHLLVLAGSVANALVICLWVAPRL